MMFAVVVRPLRDPDGALRTDAAAAAAAGGSGAATLRGLRGRQTGTPAFLRLPNETACSKLNELHVCASRC